jgi:hypothetical protein
MARSPGGTTLGGQQSSGTRGRPHAQCVAGVRLDPEAATARREKWQNLQDVVHPHGVVRLAKDSDACAAAQEFANNCPAWDADVKAIEAQLCRVAAGESAPHSGCQPHQHLQPSDRRLIDSEWGEVQAVRQAKGWDFRARFPNTTLTSACKTATDLASNCPAWDPDVQKAQAEVCDLAAKDCAPDMEPGTRRAAAPTYKGDLDSLLRMDPGLSSMNDPNDARKMIEQARAKLKLVRCYDDINGAQLEDHVNAWASALETAIGEELKCRASVECMAVRVWSQICATMADRREAQQQIATERSNPGGAVNLVTLHDLGERIQIDNGNIANLKTQYTAMVHRGFNGACPR